MIRFLSFLLLRIKPAGNAALFLVVCGLLCPASAGSAAAAATAPFPRGMRLVLPFDGQDQMNVLSAIIEPHLQTEATGTVSVNRFPGRGGGYAWGQLVGKTAFDETVALAAVPSLILQSMQADRLFSQDDLTVAVIFAYIPNALWVTDNSPFRTVRDLVAHAAAQDQPVYIAGSGAFTDQQAANAVFARAAGIRTAYLPYVGTAQAAAAVKDQTALACWGYALPPSGMPGMRPLAVAAKKRGPALPDTPLFQEYNIDVTSGQYYGAAVPAALAEADKRAVSDLFLRMLNEKNVQDAFLAAGISMQHIPLDEAAAFMRSQQRAVDDFLREYPLNPR